MKDLGVTDLIAAFDVMIHTMLLKKMEDVVYFHLTILRNDYRCMCRL